MIKYLIPVALGGGLVWLISSSSKAQAAPGEAPAGQGPLPIRVRNLPTPEVIYNELPENLKQLVIQAYQTGDPRMFELVATQLDAYGYREQGQLLRTKGNELRYRQQPTAPEPAQVVPTSGPAPTVSPPSPAPIPSPTSTPVLAQPPSPAPAPAPPPAPAIMPVEYQQMVSTAIDKGTAEVLTSTAYVIERAGYPEVAEELRRRAREAAARVPAPAVKDRPAAVLDPGMPEDLSLYVARQLQQQGDPAALEELAAQMRARGYVNTAQQLEAKAIGIRTAHDAGYVLSQIDKEFKKTPGVASVPFNPQSAPPPAVPAVYTPVSAAPPSAAVPAAAPPIVSPPIQLPPIPTNAPPLASSLPDVPLVVPATPRPQPAPGEKPRGQVLAEALTTSLNQLIEREGSVPKARYKEDKAMVARFQTEEGLKADGKYGAKTAERLARYVSDVPAPFYWTKSTASKDLATFKSNLHTLALEAEQVGNADRAGRLRRSADRASLA